MGIIIIIIKDNDILCALLIVPIVDRTDRSIENSPYAWIR